MNSQGQTTVTGQFKTLHYEGKETNVYAFMTKHNGLIEVGMNQNLLIPEFNKDYELNLNVYGKQVLTKTGYYVLDNRLSVVNVKVYQPEAKVL